MSTAMMSVRLGANIRLSVISHTECEQSSRQDRRGTKLASRKISHSLLSLASKGIRLCLG
jgi:hypothetical protein